MTVPNRPTMPRNSTLLRFFTVNTSLGLKFLTLIMSPVLRLSSLTSPGASSSDCLVAMLPLRVQNSHDLILSQLGYLSREIPRGDKLKKHGVVQFVKVRCCVGFCPPTTRDPRTRYEPDLGTSSSDTKHEPEPLPGISATTSRSSTRTASSPHPNRGGHGDSTGTHTSTRDPSARNRFFWTR
ncbi:hypothetical protein EYF80_012054 [Liparis tanakae]|uniref:Uncharacterized protein n=1 Tax=Liparis tanakae TaxID=230148 RepID=A0A4Z2IIJ7_9TELE|nr:hypothetical protein EYF80_012054 [Liparis tanakae]